MSWNPLHHGAGTETDPDSVETLLIPRARDIGGFEVRRALPDFETKVVLI